METALSGGRTDHVPVFPIYDIGYVTRSIGLTERDTMIATSDQLIQIIEKSFLLHDVDGLLVDNGTNGQWARDHTVLAKYSD